MTELLPYQLLPAAWIVGWTLVHFLWQATLVAAVASFALACVENRSSSARYLVCALSLAAMAVAPVVTFYLLAKAPAVDVPSLALTTLVIAPDLRQRISLLVPGITLVWVAGVWVMQVRIAAQLIGARGLARASTQPLAEPQAGMVRSLCTQLGLPRAVKAYQSTRAAVPMVVGWLRPVVLVPSAAIAGLSTAQLRAVLAHELAHIKRHDALVNLAQSVFESLFFFHPAVWWLSNRLRVEREFCCDDVAVATCGDPLTYAKALAALDDARSATPAAVLAATGGSLMQRITRLLDAGASARRARTWIAPMIMTLSLTAVVSAMSLTVDEEPDASVALKGVDLVKVVAPVDGELAQILTILRQGGMDDATLLEFVTRLGTSPEVVTAIQGATEKAVLKAKHVAIKEHMSKAHQVISQDVANGLITKEEAHLRMKALHREVEQQVAELSPPSDNTLDARLPRRQTLHVGEYAKLPGAHGETQREVDHLQHKLHGLQEDFAAGRKTAEEVEPAMEKIQKHIHKLLQLEEDFLVNSSSAKNGFVLDVHPRIKLHPNHEVLVDNDIHVDLLAGERLPDVQLHPNHTVFFEDDPEVDILLPGDNFGVDLWESGEHDGVWVYEPKLIGEIQLEPLEPLEPVQSYWTVESPNGFGMSDEHGHGAEAQNLWSDVLNESTLQTLNERYQMVGESRAVGEVPNDHLLKIYAVLREMNTDLQLDTQVVLEPIRTNVLLDLSLKPVVEPIVERAVESNEWIDIGAVEVSEEPVEWIEEIDFAEEPVESVEEVIEADET